jgi:hypothetical protein
MSVNIYSLVCIYSASILSKALKTVNFEKKISSILKFENWKKKFLKNAGLENVGLETLKLIEMSS